MAIVTQKFWWTISVMIGRYTTIIRKNIIRQNIIRYKTKDLKIMTSPILRQMLDVLQSLAVQNCLIVWSYLEDVISVCETNPKRLSFSNISCCLQICWLYPRQVDPQISADFKITNYRNSVDQRRKETKSNCKL